MQNTNWVTFQFPSISYIKKFKNNSLQTKLHSIYSIYLTGPNFIDKFSYRKALFLIIKIFQLQYFT